MLLLKLNIYILLFYSFVDLLEIQLQFTLHVDEGLAMASLLKMYPTQTCKENWGDGLSVADI